MWRSRRAVPWLSLRRHYPDQVLRSAPALVPSQPGDAELPWVGSLRTLPLRAEGNLPLPCLTTSDPERQCGGAVNEVHLQRCSSAEWARAVEEFILPWALKDIDLGDDVIEVGPGPGLTTDVLRRHVSRLTAVDSPAALAVG